MRVKTDVDTVIFPENRLHSSRYSVTILMCNIGIYKMNVGLGKSSENSVRMKQSMVDVAHRVPAR
jgi:hypothetical protein